MNFFVVSQSNSRKVGDQLYYERHAVIRLLDRRWHLFIQPLLTRAYVERSNKAEVDGRSLPLRVFRGPARINESLY